MVAVLAAAAAVEVADWLASWTMPSHEGTGEGRSSSCRWRLPTEESAHNKASFLSSCFFCDQLVRRSGFELARDVYM